MDKIINSYETVFIVNPDFTEEKTNEVVDKFKSLIEKNGTIENVDTWGKRKLAYLIDDYAEGFYTLINFKSEASFIAELDRIFNITDGILRSMTIRKDV